MTLLKVTLKIVSSKKNITNIYYQKYYKNFFFDFTPNFLQKGQRII